MLIVKICSLSVFCHLQLPLFSSPHFLYAKGTALNKVPGVFDLARTPSEHFVHTLIQSQPLPFSYLITLSLEIFPLLGFHDCMSYISLLKHFILRVLIFPL